MKSPPMLFMHDFFLVVVFSFLSFFMVNSIAARFLVQANFLTRDQHPTYPQCFIKDYKQAHWLHTPNPSLCIAKDFHKCYVSIFLCFFSSGFCFAVCDVMQAIKRQAG